MNWPCVALAGVVLMASMASDARAQRPTRPASAPRRDTTERRSPADTLRARLDSIAAARDTAGKANLAEPDSVMQRLLQTRNADVTRYQGKEITFDARTKAIEIRIKPVVVREGQTVRSDSAISYSGSGSTVKLNAGATGKNTINQPGQATIVSRGIGSYDITNRRASVRGVSTSLPQSGETLQITADRGLAVLPPKSDSAANTAKDAVYYLRDGTVTACTDSIPDYYFKSREIKRTGSFVVARPAVLYIGDVPVMWLPFIFQDVRGGRHSGILAPNVGVSDIVRNSPSYRRSIEGLGYYVAISDFIDAQAFLDWRSSAGQTVIGDPGFMRYNGELRYNWLERYVTGRLAASQTTQGNAKNFAISLDHKQDFTRNSSLNASFNYVTNTVLQRQTTVNPYQVSGSIRSSANFHQKIGSADFTLGGQQTQTPGRSQLDRSFPSLNVATSPISLASWLLWSPSFNYSSHQTLRIDSPSNLGLFLRDTSIAGRDTIVGDTLRRNAYASNLGFDTPLQIFGYNLGNSFRVSSTRNDYPELQIVTGVLDGVATPRVFSSTFSTQVDWTPSFQLPPVARNNFNLTPGASLENVDGSAFAIRNERTNGAWVYGAKRPTFSLSAAPTLFGLFGGFGPFTRFRHSISPQVSYQYAPARELSHEYLAAIGRSKFNTTTGDTTGYLGSLARNQISLSLSTNIEAKTRSLNDSNPEAGDKIKLLSLNFTSLAYDFERARVTGKPIRGLTSQSFGYTAKSDLLPGLDVGVDYSLFDAPTVSDSAVFKPFRDRVTANFTFSNTANPFAMFTRLFGRAVPVSQPNPDTSNPAPDDRYQRAVASQPVAGRNSSRAALLQTATRGWQASFQFTAVRHRPQTGTNVVAYDPTVRCQQFNTPQLRAVFDQCVAIERTNPSSEPPPGSNLPGSTVYLVPNTTSLGSNLSFNVTEHWAATYQTNYDFEGKSFASQIVSLQRDLHDWRAIFAFTQSANGAFAFNFLISLKAEPELKFDYHKSTYRGSGF